MATILKPYTFVAGTKARAAEVNADFDTLYTEVNSVDSKIVDIQSDITSLQTNKANINGNYGNRFSVADPVNSYDAVNKEYLVESQSQTRPYINGLGITQGGNTYTIIVSAGSCYDSTYEQILTLDDSTEKENTTQAASTTYYVFIIGKDEGADEDVLISTTSVNPPLPTDYKYYRLLGRYTTNSDSEINAVYNEEVSQYSGSTGLGQMANVTMPAITPKYSDGVTVSYDSSYNWTAIGNGWICCTLDSLHGETYNNAVYVNGVQVAYNGDTQENSSTVWFLIRAGQTLHIDYPNGWTKYYPCTGTL